jgi:proteasome-associated ATPase
MGDMQDDQEQPTSDVIIGPGDQVQTLTADKARLQEKLERTTNLLKDAKKQLELSQSANEKLQQAPAVFGIFDDRTDDKNFVDIHRNGQKLRAAVSGSINVQDLQRGQQLLLNDSGVVIKALSFEGHGEIMTVKEVAEDGKRAIVVSHHGEEKMVHLADAIVSSPIKAGNSLLVNMRTHFAFELVSKTEVNDLMLEEVPDIAYTDIGGLADQIDKIRDAVELPYLHADLYTKYDLSPTKGVLLYGPPGCGKTLIAKAIANSLAKKVTEKTGHDVKSYFLNVKGPELLNKYVGETERHIRLIFERAREKASAGHPVVIFFDEMEAMFHTRGSGISSDVEKTIVPQLLAELDGVESLENVLVIGASNRQDMIDPAILRPGRLDIKIKIERPDAVAAADIFSKYLTSNLPLHKLELDEHRDGPEACVSHMISQVVDCMYATTQETEFLQVHYRDGSNEILHYKDFSSGAMIKNIVDRAKKAAIKEYIGSGQSGLRLQYLLDACAEEFQSNDDLPNTSNPDDWAKISGRKGAAISHVTSLIRHDTSNGVMKEVETVVQSTGHGQYL